MLIDLVIARLKSQVPNLKKVGTAADLGLAKGDASNQYPRAYVMVVAEHGSQNRYMTGAVAQERQVHLAVVLVARNVRDAAGAAAGADMEVLRQVTDAALFGWTPTEVHQPLVFSTGKLLTLLDGELWWQDEYATAYDRR